MRKSMFKSHVVITELVFLFEFRSSSIFDTTFAAEATAHSTIAMVVAACELASVAAAATEHSTLAMVVAACRLASVAAAATYIQH